MKAPNIRKKLLEKMLRLEYIGARHMAYDEAGKGFPKHLRKEVKRAADELIRSEIILRRPTSYGLRISLNPHKMDEIERIVRDP